VLEAIYAIHARRSDHPRILAGDFNPQMESEDGQTITWAQKVDSGGTTRLVPSLGERGYLGQWRVLRDLERHRLPDV
jgi:hypothetical protein